MLINHAPNTYRTQPSSLSVLPQINRNSMVSIPDRHRRQWRSQVMHAWLRLSGYQRLSMDVEEGLAQLMALLWLERQTPQPVRVIC